MAAGGGGQDLTPNHNLDADFVPPITPRMIVRPDSEAEMRPDTEDNVVNQTDGIFRSFVTNMYVHDRQSSTTDESPRFGELMFGAPENPLSRASEIGRRLAQIGDTVNERYSSEFNEMIKMLNPTPETAFEAFYNVAERLFRDGTIHWGRVLTLLCFGYRLAVAVLNRGIRGFFIKIIEYLIKYITISKIAQWIANQGGWRAVLNLVPDNIGWAGVGVVVTVAMVTLATVFCIGRKM